MMFILLITIFLAVPHLLSTDGAETESSINQEHLIWFLQITDMHLSAFQDPSRITDLKDFCLRTVDVIKPPVVLASGDLTDGRTANGVGSHQSEKEWQYYKSLLDECKIVEKTMWLDIRGNHDNFNVLGPESQQNFFTNYSIQGRRHPRSYMYQISHGSELYSFISIDACVKPGPGYPFNFIGRIDQTEIDQINNFIEKTKTSGSNYTVWFGHYPTSCILSSGNEGVRALIGKDSKGLAYVCGHLHTLGGLVRKMYTLQNSGFLELELGDWKHSRVYRLLAIDHGMLSFVDVPHGEWPVGLITNPKHALFINLMKENVENIKTSTHIRVLAFSLGAIASVKVRIDDNEWMHLHHVSGPLYVLKWNPNKYSTGLHTIDLHIEDEHGREKFDSQPFTMDDSRLSFDLSSRIILTTDARTIFQVLFAIGLIICLLPLIVFKLLLKLVEVKKIPPPRFGRNCCKVLVRKFWILSTVDRVFWPLLLYPVYLSIGPWTIGYLVEDYIGAIFNWGIIVNGSYLPGSATYAFGFIQLSIFQLPFTFILAHAVDYTIQYKVLVAEKKKICGQICLYLPFFVVLGIQFGMVWWFWLTQGTLGLILGPLRIWSLVFAGALWYIAINLPDRCTRKAAQLLRVVPESAHFGSDFADSDVTRRL